MYVKRFLTFLDKISFENLSISTNIIIRVETTKLLQYQCKILDNYWVVFIFCENCQFQFFIKLKLAQFFLVFKKLIGYQDFYLQNFS